MVSLSGILLSGFYASLFGLFLFSSPVGCCLFLLLGLISLSGFVYLFVGVSWYLTVLCLVYVGGVFVLLVYVSLFVSNYNSWFAGSWGLMGGFTLFLLLLLNGLFGLGWIGWGEASHYLCLYEGGFSYCFFCVVLLLSFGLISFICGSKEGYFR